MTAPKNALLLVGSPKGLKRGSSTRLGGLLFDHLEKRGIDTDACHIHAVLRSRDPQILRNSVAGADLVVLATPLYVDSLPAPVIWAMYLTRSATVSLAAVQVPPLLLATRSEAARA